MASHNTAWAGSPVCCVSRGYLPSLRKLSSAVDRDSNPVWLGNSAYSLQSPEVGLTDSHEHALPQPQAAHTTLLFGICAMN